MSVRHPLARRAAMSLISAFVATASLSWYSVWQYSRHSHLWTPQADGSDVSRSFGVRWTIRHQQNAEQQDLSSASRTVFKPDTVAVSHIEVGWPFPAVQCQRAHACPPPAGPGFIELMPPYMKPDLPMADLGTYRPYWSGLSANLAIGTACALGLGCARAGCRSVRDRVTGARRIAQGCCPGCGYNLIGLAVGSACPECGSPK